MEGEMSDIELDAKKIEEKVSDLAEAMNRVRNNQAERDDVVVDMKQASHARLELLGAGPATGVCGIAQGQ